MRKLFCFLLLLFPIFVNAKYEVIDSRCTTELKLSLKEAGNDVTYRLSKSEKDGNISYALILYNVTDDMYITNSENVRYKDTKIDNLTPGSSFIINIYASNKNYCDGYKIGSKIINVPYYNKYSKDKLCEGYESYYLCKEDSNITLSEDEFKKEMNSYIESLKKSDKKEEKEIEDSSFNILNFIDEYKYYIIGGVSLIIISIVVIVIVKRKKDDDIL